MSQYPKRLIEVDLPIKRISAHARREKSIRHGHISTLHIWWARRPLAACRAVICASLWPDPADPLCPPAFRTAAAKQMLGFAQAVYRNSDISAICDDGSWKRYGVLAKDGKLTIERPADMIRLRGLLLDFIADFAAWEASTNPTFMGTARALTHAAHVALGGAAGTKPLVIDPFAGGGAIPLEALRVGADAFASDLNPVAVLLNRVILEYIPKYGRHLADGVRRWGQRIKEQADKELAEFYPRDSNGATPIAYLWARTIKCEGPGCSTDVPILTKTLLAQRKLTNIVLRYRADSQKQVLLSVEEQVKSKPVQEGTVRRSSVTCPACGYTTPAANVRKQLAARKGGTLDARLLAVVVSNGPGQSKAYRVPNKNDLAAVERAKGRLPALRNTHDSLSAIPREPLPYLRSIFNINLLGVTEWGQLLTPRQSLHLTTFVKLIRQESEASGQQSIDIAVASCIGIVLDKMVDFHTSLTRWIHIGEKIGNTFGRQALGIIWDYAEANPFADISGSWDRCVDYLAKVIQHIATLGVSGHVQQASATEHPLPDDSASVLVTDPPYYDLVPYADLSDFFYVWLKRTLGHLHKPFLDDALSPKEKEIVQLAERNPAYAYKTRENYQKLMGLAMEEGRRVLSPTGVGVVFFAHKGTSAWETQLQAMVDAGWVIVGSWPLATEREGRLRAMDSAVLASSIQLVCRPRENADGSVRMDEIGDWREVLAALPKRIHEWMPRLAEEGVVGADAIFACLGPALEIFSRYSRVEKASGEAVTLREYLEQVWAAVSKEALSMLFRDADAAGLEPDARLTAMWLWTLGTGAGGQGSGAGEEPEEDASDDEEEGGGKKATAGGYAMEFDAARKIAQGLGVHLEKAATVVAVEGETARLLPVAERARHLFGKDAEAAPSKGRGKKKPKQLSLFEELDEAEASEAGWGDMKVPPPGTTVLDRVHQAMILFAAGRSEAMRRFLVEEGIGREGRFWKLAQALSALYPSGSEEKRWVDGVLARKKGLGL